MLRGHTSGVMKLAFSPDGRRLLTSSIDNTAKIWDTMSVAEAKDLPRHAKAIHSGGFDVWRVGGGRCKPTLPVGGWFGNCVSWVVRGSFRNQTGRSGGRSHGRLNPIDPARRPAEPPATARSRRWRTATA